MLLKGDTKRAYNLYLERIREYDNEKSVRGGQLALQDCWKYAYYKSPYLLLEEDETIKERFSDVFTNGFEISEEGKMSFTPMSGNDHQFSKLLTEMLEEMNWRGIISSDLKGSSKDQVQAYFSGGIPKGVKLFEGVKNTSNNWLLKFSQREYVEDMYKFGRFRISPASYYSKGSHIRAMKDLETVRDYRLRSINDILKGIDSVEFQGEKTNIINGIVPIQFVMGNYFLFCTCRDISRRMPTDFEADSVLIIKNKGEFIQRIKTELQISYPDWEFLERNVYYYDPYHDLPTDRDQEFYKHLSYAYQKEHRCILRPKNPNEYVDNLEPFFIELGALSDISEIRTID